MSEPETTEFRHHDLEHPRPLPIALAHIIHHPRREASRTTAYANALRMTTPQFMLFARELFRLREGGRACDWHTSTIDLPSLSFKC